MRSFLLLALIGACAGPDTGQKKKAPALVDECDPTVVAASPLAATNEGVVTPHEEVFGALQPYPLHLHLGWPSSDPSNSISFVWRTDVDTVATVVEYGKDGELTERVEGHSYLYGGVDAGEGPYRVHEIKLCGELEPNTTYTYRAGGDGFWSPEHSFTTPGPPGSFDTFRVGMLGDSRGAYESLDDLIASMETHSPDFYLFSGDMVELGPSQAEWDGWFDAMGEVFAENVVVPVHGNHEFLAVHHFAQFSLPNNEEWFSLRYGDLHLVVLNDTVGDLAHRSVDQVEYLDQAFSEHESGWQIVSHHQPMYTVSTRHRSNTDLREYWEPLYDQYGVDLVVTGHNHLYERSVPIRAGAPATPETGTVHIVTGGAGAPLYSDIEPDWYGEVSNPVEHYVIADFGPTGIEVVARDRSDNVIDSFTIPRR